MYSVKTAIKHHLPAVFLAKLLPRRTMKVLRISFGIGTIVSGLIYVVLISSGNDYFADKVFGLTLIILALWIEQLMIYSYHNYYYFFGLNSIIGIDKITKKGTTYEIAQALRGQHNDIALGFANSRLGNQVLLRSGLTPEQIGNYLNSDRVKYTTEQIPVEEGSVFTLVSLGTWLFQNDFAFAKMLTEAGVQETDYFGSLGWVTGNYHNYKRTLRWWSKDQLSQSQGLARDWSYGHTYHLQTFTSNIYNKAIFSKLTNNKDFSKKYVDELEETFAKAQSANALIIGKAGVGKMDIVITLQDRIKNGKATASILDQTFSVLSTEALFSVSQDKQAFENNFLRVMNEAIEAGNISIVINNIGTFIKEAESLGVFIPELLDVYLSHPSFHIIALDTPENFHNVLSRNQGFIRRFEEILIEEPGQESLINLLSSIAVHNENNGLFTYPSLSAIAAAAERYIVDGVMPDKAVSLLSAVASKAPNSGQYTPEFVYQVVAEKTGMPVGPVNEAERDTLLNLEANIHARVIGQDRAITAISKTMRRARAGIVSGEQPIGTFLFLGPTGVGKTETAKALAHVFFGDEKKMTRLDMSEFSTQETVHRLIGDADSSGVLTSLLQERPYTVLLLDEFEKAAREVHDLFLQILDEGSFTSGQGKTVNARNTIIIATSNAGSQFIIEALQQKADLSSMTRVIIDKIIADGIFRPELVNRFDNTILFEPLSLTQQHSIAQLMIAGLQERIEDQGYHLNVTPSLISALATKGYDPVFGARPMQNVIQNTIEEAIANKIIAGSLTRGQTINLDVTDVNFTD